MSDALLAFGGHTLQQYTIGCQVWSTLCALLLIASRILFSGESYVIFTYTSTSGQVNLRDQLQGVLPMSSCDA